jgi:long-chain acyl-CoA synthetase
VLYRHPAVREVAVYGAPDPDRGEEVRAAIVLREGASASPEALAQFCREHLAAYKVPQRVELVPELPKSATGKILKRVLREQAAKD